MILIVLCQVFKYLIDKFESFSICHIAVLIVKYEMYAKENWEYCEIWSTLTTLLYFGQQHYKSTMLHQTTGLIVEDMLYYGAPNPSY